MDANEPVSALRASPWHARIKRKAPRIRAVFAALRRARENRKFDEEGFPTVRQAHPELINSEEILDRIEKVTRNTLVTLHASAKQSDDGSRSR